ncbi:MAG: molecular chaperone Tir [Gemmatimonadetes bacterium]|nr:molecular chaperone Tir [Gemmatimonadota bacterium]|tara:strand:- start:20 stop:421 length:402 start_codon:yes stop_codon:yes gene_type:complete
MVETFERIKDLALELGLAIEKEIPDEEILIVNDPDRGISQMVIDCEDTILVIEQLIFEIDSPQDTNMYRRLLEINRDLVFGAFVIDETGNRVLYRNTLVLDNLDANRLESTINALVFGLAEYGQEILSFIGEK